MYLIVMNFKLILVIIWEKSSAYTDLRNKYNSNLHTDNILSLLILYIYIYFPL
jgi:hypothetical protein